ncbi:MAG: type II secretion system F family protein [Betaproteobacteria bacterium]|nr:type II secretion system F family protein [Betaproteobacteria bacterium]
MRYLVKAFRTADGVSTFELDAADSESARQQAESRGYRVIDVAAPAGRRFSGLAASRFSVPLFCQELLSLLDAGMGLVEAVAILARKARQGQAHRHLEALQRLLGEGQAFSRALEGLPDVFPALLVATVKSAERTGDLNEALRRYLAYHRQLNAVRDKMLAASVYPALLVGVGLLVVFFLLGYVVPRFAKVYEDVGGDRLPVLSRALMQWGQFAGEHAAAFALAAAAVLAGLVYALSRPALRAAVMRRLWQLPFLGEQFRIYQLARFTRTVAMLLKGGVPLVAALDMTDSLLPQPALQTGLVAARKAIREGRMVSDAFGMNGLSTEVGTRLLVVGERSGELGAMMERIAVFYDEQISRTVDWASRLFEPVLMVVIGFLIGGIVILMYLPIFELASSLQ